MTIHIVGAGESIYSIAAEYGVPPEQLITDNGLPGAEQLVPGQALVIIYRSRTVTVQPGDTLYSIAVENGVSAIQLLRNNPFLDGLSAVSPGQVLAVDFAEPRLGSVRTNGYVYTSVERDTLLRTLPYLTYLTIFTYGFTESGELIGPEGDDALIALAGDYGVAPIMMLSTLTEEGSFSNELSSALFASTAVQDVLIENVYSTIRAKGYYGLDVDFEYVFQDEGDEYAAFIRRITDRFAGENIPVWVSLAPKTSTDQPGILYEAHNYAALGDAADYCTVMTYEWGYRYGPPMAVAPLNKVREVVDYAITQIPPSRLFMGIPNYGYDWTLPYIRGESAAPSIGSDEALRIAYENGASVSFDAVAASPFFRYFAGGAEHEVWFEDARSIRAKLELLKSRGLVGGAWWNIMRWFCQGWTTTNALYNIETVV